MHWKDDDDYRESFRRCPACGALVDGDVCDQTCAEVLDARRAEQEARAFDAGVRRGQALYHRDRRRS